MPPKFTPPIESFTPSETFREKQKRFHELNQSGKTEEATALFREILKEVTAENEKLISPLERALNLKEQYENQVKILQNTGILQELESGSPFANPTPPTPLRQRLRRGEGLRRASVFLW